MSQFHDPRQKKPKTVGDLAVATISQDGVIVTGNYAHFDEISSQFPPPGLYNPFDDGWIIEPVGPAPGVSRP